MPGKNKDNTIITVETFNDHCIENPKIRISGIKLKLMAVDFKTAPVEAGRAFLYVLRNELHVEPFGFVEDVFVEPAFRGQGLVNKLMNRLVKEAKKAGCYKVVACSRFEREKVHEIYEKLGFVKQGLEFRLDLQS